MYLFLSEIQLKQSGIDRCYRTYPFHAQHNLKASETLRRLFLWFGWLVGVVVGVVVVVVVVVGGCLFTRVAIVIAFLRGLLGSAHLVAFHFYERKHAEADIVGRDIESAFDVIMMFP